VQLILESHSLFLQLLDYSGHSCHLRPPLDDSRDRDRIAFYTKEECEERLLGRERPKPDVVPYIEGERIRIFLPIRISLTSRLECIFHASFRPCITTMPLRFAITSPPSGSEEDFHFQAVEHARHTERAPAG
jgi:hypothetical protein